VARLRHRLLEQQRQEAQGGSYPNTRGADADEASGWGTPVRGASAVRGEEVRQAEAEKKKMAIEELRVRQAQQRKEHAWRREHDEKVSERLEARGAIAARYQRLHRQSWMAQEDLEQVMAGGNVEKALTRALAAKEALLDAIKAKSDALARFHARTLHASLSRRERLQGHARQHRMTDEMRSDEVALRNLEASQEGGVIRKVRAVRDKTHEAEQLSLSHLRNQRLTLQHKLLVERIQGLRAKLDGRGVAASLRS